MEKNKQTINRRNNNAGSAPTGPGTKPRAAGGKPKTVFAGKKGAARERTGRGRGGSRSDNQEEFEQRIVDIARVTRVMAGGKRMRFRACVAVGNKKGKVGVGLAKGADVTLAVTKAVTRAKKDIIDVPIVNGTIPHDVYWKKGAAKVLLKPARRGKGVMAGGALRVVLELTGIENITSKILGTNNKLNISKCAIEALASLKKVEPKKESKTEKIEKNSDKGAKQAETKGKA